MDFGALRKGDRGREESISTITTDINPHCHSMKEHLALRTLGSRYLDIILIAHQI